MIARHPVTFVPQACVPEDSFQLLIARSHRVQYCAGDTVIYPRQVEVLRLALQVREVRFPTGAYNKYIPTDGPDIARTGAPATPADARRHDRSDAGLTDRVGCNGLRGCAINFQRRPDATRACHLSLVPPVTQLWPEE